MIKECQNANFVKTQDYMTIKENVPLRDLNTFRVAVKAAYLAEVFSKEDIAVFIGAAPLPFSKWMILGGGSNILFTGDFDGCIIKPVIKGVEITSVNEVYAEVRAGAGEDWDEFVGFCVSKGYWGLENLSWIPGTVGASPVQNIGAYGTEAKDAIVLVEGIEMPSGREFSLSAGECRFSYRSSIFKKELRNKALITHVTYRLSRRPKPATGYRDLAEELKKYPSAGIGEIRSAIIAIRKRKLPDPENMPNAGSFFKNPFIDRKLLTYLQDTYDHVPFFEDSQDNIKLPAAWLIEKCGLKGVRDNSTGTHINQPLVIINYGDASGKEILAFAEKIKDRVYSKFGISLETEVNII